ncbi:YeaC family protein [Colwelliaceae bacterium MEBiC 14330]
MDLLNTIDTMSEEMYLRLKCAAETGKWPEGTVVDEAQRATALQLSMAYQARHFDNDELLTIGADGQIVEKNKRQLKSEFSNFKPKEEIKPCSKPTQADIAYFSNDEL